MQWPDDIIDMVWRRAATVDGYEPRLWRKDAAGAWIARLRYGDRASDYGWDIVRMAPGEPDAPANLQPLHWQNCPESSGAPLRRVIAKGMINVSVEQQGMVFAKFPN